VVKPATLPLMTPTKTSAARSSNRLTTHNVPRRPEVTIIVFGNFRRLRLGSLARHERARVAPETPSRDAQNITDN